LVGIEILEKRPEVSYAVGHGVWMIGVGLAARESQFVAAAGGLLPVGELVPIKTVELPSDAVTKAAEVLEREVRGALSGAGGRCGRQGSRILWDGGDGAKDLFAEGFGVELTSVDVDVADRVRAVVRRSRADQLGNGDWFAKVVLVLDPIEMNAEAGELLRIEVALFE